MTVTSIPPPPLTPAPSESTTVEGTGTVTIPTMHEPANDTITVRMVIGCIFGIAVAALIILAVLILSDKTLPEGVVIGLLNLTVGGLGALGGLLASTASRRT